MRVRVRQTVKQFGWYGKQRLRPGVEFDIAGEHELCAWMEPVFLDEPEESEPEPELTVAPIKRVRRTKAQMLADKKALADGKKEQP